MGRSDNCISNSPRTHPAAPRHGNSALLVHSPSRIISPLPASGSSSRNDRIDVSSSTPNSGLFAYTPGVMLNAFFPSSVTATTTPLYNTTVQSYRGGAIDYSEPWDVNSPSHLSTPTNNYSSSHIGLPAQVPGGILERYDNPAAPLQDTAFQPSVSYGGSPIITSYESYVGHAPQFCASELSDNRGYLLPGPSTRDLALQSPSSSTSLSPAPWPEIYHPNDNSQAVVPYQQGGQQPGAPQTFNIIIDGDDRSVQGSAITVGQCLRTDSPCGLWVKCDKKSIKRHDRKWHGVGRGGDTNMVPCTWSGCTNEMQKAHVPRHTLRRHFGETFQCNGCSKLLSRQGCWNSHAQQCEFSSYGHSVLYDHHTRVLR